MDCLVGLCARTYIRTRGNRDFWINAQLLNYEVLMMVLLITLVIERQ